MKSEARNQEYSKNTRIYRVLAVASDFFAIVFSSCHLKKVETLHILQCFSLDLVIRNVCCSMVVHTCVVLKQWKTRGFISFFLISVCGSCVICRRVDCRENIEIIKVL